MGCPETPVIIYQSTPRQIPEKDLIYTSVESRTVYVIGNYYSLAPTDAQRMTKNSSFGRLVCQKIKRQLR
jgi:hypothetical protein